MGPRVDLRQTRQLVGRRARPARLVPPRHTPPVPASVPSVEAQRWAEGGAGSHLPQGLARTARESPEYPAASWNRRLAVVSSVAASRKIHGNIDGQVLAVQRTLEDRF